MSKEQDHVPSKQTGEQPEAHQNQAGSSTDRSEDEWKHREPYRVHDSETNEKFPVKWEGSCHCGKVTYQLSREKPLAAKYCHCTTCQRLHGSPFQWAAIFHKSDINFTNGHHDLGCFLRVLPLPIMDEGRNMVLLFPPLIKKINTPEGREAFRPTCHMFYPQRVADFKGDGIVKWRGLDNKSDLLDDDENVLVKWEEALDGKKMDEKKRQFLEFTQKEGQVKRVKNSDG